MSTDQRPCRYFGGMASTLTIRNVPDETHRTLAARAAASGQSLQEFLLGQVTELAARPTVDEVLRRARRRVTDVGGAVGTSAIVDALHADRDR